MRTRGDAGRDRLRQLERGKLARERDDVAALGLGDAGFVHERYGTLRQEFWVGDGVSRFANLTSGAVAQLGERLNGIQEVTSSILVGSTNLELSTYAASKDAAFCVDTTQNRQTRFYSL